MKNYYEQLIGATITRYEEVEDEYTLDHFPCYDMTLKDGTKIRVEVSCDEEGNGGGFLFIGPETSSKYITENIDAQDNGIG